MNAKSPMDKPAPTKSSESKSNFDQLGPYSLEALVQEHHDYALFLATHTKRKHRVHLYVLPPVKGDPQAFLADVEIAGKIKHPSVASVVDSGEADGCQYVAYEYVDGVVLSTLVRGEGKIAPSVACAIIRQAAIGLHHVHENGLLHGGVSPTHLIVTKSGVVKILGLGVALHATNPRAAQNAGQANFLAPEQFEEHTEPRTDIYGLGGTLHFMLVGKVPPARSDHSSGDEALPITKLTSDLGASLVAAVKTMLEIDPTKRIQLLTQVVGAMCNWASEEQLPSLVARNRPQMPASQPVKPQEPVTPISKEPQPVVEVKPSSPKQSELNPKKPEFAMPPSSKSKSKLGPAVVVLALALAVSYGGFLYLAPPPDPTVSDAATDTASAAAASSSLPLQAKLGLPKRIAETPTSSDAEAEQAAPQPAQTQAEPSVVQHDAESSADVPIHDPVAESESQAANTQTKPVAVTSKTPASTQASSEATLSAVEGQGDSQINQQGTSSVEHREIPAFSGDQLKVADKSVDEYHNQLAKQLHQEYGLTDGKWVLTPNEFALISSVVSYGQRVSQDETSEDVPFGRMVRMHVSGKGSNAWASGLYIPEVDRIEKGDRVLVVCWLRTSPKFEGEGKVGIFVESASDHTKEVYLTVKPTSEWRQFLIPFQAKVARDLRVGFHLAFHKQEIDYGGLTLINFGKTAPFWNAIPAGPRRRPTDEEQ